MKYIFGKPHMDNIGTSSIKMNIIKIYRKYFKIKNKIVKLVD